MNCNFRVLNKIIVPDFNYSSLFDEFVGQISEVVIFFQIDLIGAFHQMRMAEKDIHKTALRARFGWFE